MQAAVEGFSLVVNGRAGSVDEDAVAAVRERLAAHGAAVDVVATEQADDVGAVVRDLPRGWALVACGGDGSLHVVVQQLYAHGRGDVPLGLVPLGTGNDLARGLGLPLDDPAAAAARIADGSPTPLDLLVDDEGRVCANALHVGLGAEVSAQASGMKEQLSSLAYPVAALLAGLGEPARETVVEVDGERVADGPVLMVGVGNGPSIGGGTRLIPDADPADALLDVVVVGAIDGADRLGFGLDLQRGRHLERADVERRRGRQVTIHMPGGRHAVDGEVEDAVDGTRRWRVAPAAWQLLR
jgi:diacylglycerol kinase family enzyme